MVQVHLGLSEVVFLQVVSNKGRLLIQVLLYSLLVH